MFNFSPVDLKKKGNFVKKFIVLLFLPVLFFILPGCEDSADNRPVVTVSASIASVTTWVKDNIYHVTGDISIGALLTIEPGSKVIFDENCSLIVEADGGIQADGDSDAKILFTSAAKNPASGDWGGLQFNAGIINSCLYHCIIEYAGSYTDGAVWVEDSNYKISFDENIVRNCSNYAIVTANGGTFDECLENVFENIDGNFMKLDASSAGAITSAGIENTYTGSGGIVMTGTVSSSATWADCGVPYLLPDGLVVNGTSVPVLTIEPGVTIKIGDGRTFEIREGAVSAVGTADKRITISSASASPTAGCWEEIYLGPDADAANTEFRYCDISYANTGLFLADYNFTDDFYVSDTVFSNMGNTPVSFPPGDLYDTVRDNLDMSGDISYTTRS